MRVLCVALCGAQVAERWPHTRAVPPIPQHPAGEFYPALAPTGSCCLHRHLPLQVGSISSPLLVMHGERDRVVPYSHGQVLLPLADRIYSVCRSHIRD